MRICYVDESGDAGTLKLADTTSNPFFVIVGLIIEQRRIIPLTDDFLKLKNRFFPNLSKDVSHSLDIILTEVKGCDLRRNIRTGNRRVWQNTIGYLDGCIKLLQNNNIKLVSRIFIKCPGRQNSDAALYGKGIMHICENFNVLLELTQEYGCIIADSRKHSQNVRTTHTIFTQRHQSRGNSYPRIIEMPAYGHSENFAMLQLTDTVCSAILFPTIADVYNTHLLGSNNKHISEEYTTIRNRYKDAIKKLQFSYQNVDGFWYGGIFVQDVTPAGKKTSAIFR